MKVNTDHKKMGVVKELLNVNTQLRAEWDLRIKYRLMEAGYAEKSLYLIEINSAEESKIVFAGNDESKAKSLFNALVGGDVTPCTADDVARDLLIMLYDEK